MMDSVMSPLFDPAVESKLCTILLVLSMAVGLCIIFLALLAARIDGIIQCSWSVVWIPTWLLDLILIAMIGVMPNSQNDKERLLNNYKRSLWLIYMILFILLQILAVLRLDNQILWSAVSIAIPYFIIEGIQLVVNCIEGVAGCSALIAIEERRKIMSFLVNQFFPGIIRSSTIVLIVLRIDGLITCSWGVVFMPLYLVALKKAISLVHKYVYFSKLVSQPDVAQQGKMTVIVSSIVFVVLGTLFYALVALAARRLDGMNSIPMSSVLLPFFIIFVSR